MPRCRRSRRRRSPTEVRGSFRNIAESCARVRAVVDHENQGDALSYGAPDPGSSRSPRRYETFVPGAPVLDTKTYSLFSVAPPPVEWNTAFTIVVPDRRTLPGSAAMIAFVGPASPWMPR